MEITKERIKDLRSQNFGTLQSTMEFKDYLRRFVYNESKLMNGVVEYILKKSIEDGEAPFSYDDIDLFYFDIEEAKDYLKQLNPIDHPDLDLEEYNKLKQYLFECDLTIDEMEKEDFEMLDFIDLSDYERQAEIYQWFMMDERLLTQLEDRGEIVLDGSFWGRQSFGQAIEMDGVIIQIFKEWYLNFYEGVNQ